MIDRGMIGVLVDYYMGPFSPYKDTIHRVPIGDSPRESANLEYFMDILANLVRSTNTAGAVIAGTKPATCWPDDEELAEMPLKCFRLLFNKEFFASVLKQAYNVRTNEVVCSHHSWGDEERSLWFLDMVMKYISSDEHHRVLCPVLEAILGVKDSLQQWRVIISLNPKDNGLMHLVDKSNSNPVFVVAAVALVLQLFEVNPVAAHYLYRTKDQWWPALEAWLTKNRSYASFEWKKLDDPEDKLLKCAKQLNDLWERIENADKLPEKDRIAMAWDHAVEEKDRADRKYWKFNFNKQ